MRGGQRSVLYLEERLVSLGWECLWRLQDQARAAGGGAGWGAAGVEGLDPATVQEEGVLGAWGRWQHSDIDPQGAGSC